MKHLFETIGNLIAFFAISLANLLFIFWYGKLPKVSVWHQFHDSDTTSNFKPKDICNDEQIQAYKFPSSKIVTAQDLVWKVELDIDLMNANITCFNNRRDKSFDKLLSVRLNELMRQLENERNN